MKMRFHKVNIEISNICNLQCSFCPEVKRTKGMMGLDLFRKVIDQVAPFTEQVCFHLMGEPLVHPQLKEFIEICHENHVKIFFVTNGVLMQESKAYLLLHPAIRQVNFSLHSFADNYPDRDPVDYLNRIYKFVDKALLERPDLYVNFRLWNLQDIRGTTELNHEILESIEKHFNFEFNPSIDVRSYKSVRIKQRLYLHFDTEFTWPSLDLPVLGTKGFCYGLKSHFGVLVDGTVVPCCLDKEAAIPLGNLDQQPLGSILESQRAKDIFQGFQKGKLVEDLCQRCQYIERFANP